MIQFASLLPEEIDKQIMVLIHTHSMQPGLGQLRLKPLPNRDR